MCAYPLALRRRIHKRFSNRRRRPFPLNKTTGSPAQTDYLGVKIVLRGT